MHTIQHMNLYVCICVKIEVWAPFRCTCISDFIRVQYYFGALVVRRLLPLLLLFSCNFRCAFQITYSGPIFFAKFNSIPLKFFLLHIWCLCDCTIRQLLCVVQMDKWDTHTHRHSVIREWQQVGVPSNNPHLPNRIFRISIERPAIAHAKYSRPARVYKYTRMTVYTFDSTFIW